MSIGKHLYRVLYWKIFQFGSSFLVNLSLVRLFQSLLAAEFYSLLYIFSFSISFFTLGLDISLNFYLSRHRISPVMAARVVVVVTALALLVSLPILHFYARPSRYPDLGEAKLLLFAALYIAGGLLTSLSGAFFTAEGKNHFPSRLSAMINFGMAVLILLVPRLLARPQAIEYIFFTYFAFSFGQGLWLFGGAVRLTPDPDKANRRPVHIQELLRYSFTAFVTNLIFFMGARLCLYLLPYRVSLSELGNYIQAFKIIEYGGLITTALYYPLITVVAGAGSRINDRILFLVRLSNTGVALLSLFLSITGRWLFPLVFGGSFDRMYGVFCYLIPGLFGSCSSVFFTAYYFGSGHIRYNFISACILLLSGGILFFLLTPSGGIHGAAIAYSGAALASMAYDCIVFRRFTRYRLPALLFADVEDWKALRMSLFRGRSTQQ